MANPDIADAGYGGILVLLGAENGCEGVMRLRLRRIDSNPNSLVALAKHRSGC